VLKKYGMLDPVLFRNHDRHLKFKLVNYHIIENCLNHEEADSAALALSKYDVGLVNTEQYNNTEHLNWKFLTESESKEMEHVESVILTKALEANKRIFNFNLDSTIGTKYLVYVEGDRSDWHIDGSLGLRDQIDPDVVWRKVTMIVGLTDDYDGGLFQFINPSKPPESCIFSVKISKGDALMIPPYLMHRVTPVTRGVRKVLVFWLCGPRWT
jgi:predicted 2-oxoglutarate/Fe(II)-dependent dioxygenase YbiX